MSSLTDIFTPSFFMILGIVVLLIALLVVYFENKFREENHKIASMLSLVSSLADEMNGLRSHLMIGGGSGGIGMTQPFTFSQNLEQSNNDVHLIPVSDDEDSDNDEDEDDLEDEDEESDDEESDDEESDNESLGNVNIIEIGNNDNGIKVLHINQEEIFDIEDDSSLDEDDLENVANNFNEEDSDESYNGNGNGNGNENENLEEIENQVGELKPFDFKTISISNLEESELKFSDIVDYKKLSLNKLKSIVVEKGLISDPSKLKKPELLKLLGVE